MSRKNKNKERKKRPVSVVCSALGTALLIGIILICLPLTIPKVFGGEIFTVISGSMEPSIPVGSLVYIRGENPADIEEEDVIAFYGGRDTNAIITHRVVENRVVMGEFITKGDANKKEDMNPIPYELFIGKVALSVPYLGVAAQFLTSKEGKILIGALIFIAFLLEIIATFVVKNEE